MPDYLSAVTLFINPVWKQMCSNCWPETGDQSIYFSPVYWETTYKLRLYLSCNSSQVWPTRISGVIEGVFRCSGPNSQSIVTWTRPKQRKNAPPRSPPPFLGIAATGDFFLLIIVKQKSVQGAWPLRQMQFLSMPNTWRLEILWDLSVSHIWRCSTYLTCVHVLSVFRLN